MCAKLLVVFSFQESNSKEKEFECERISTRRVIGIPGVLSYVLSHMCWRCCDYWHILCYETPGNTRGSAWSGERWRRFSQNKKTSAILHIPWISWNRSGTWQNLSLVYLFLCVCEISADFTKKRKHKTLEISLSVLTYSPDIRVLSIYLQVYTCNFTRLCPKAGRVLNSARFLFFF